MENSEGEKLELNEYLQKMRTNPVANNGTGQYFTTKSGDKLYNRAWLSDNTKRIIVGIHGFAAHGEYYVQVADQMISSGISTYSLDLKHHGRSSGARGHVESLQELINQINEFILCLKNIHENVPIFLMGLSMGGCITANYTLMFPGSVSGIILMAPAVKRSLKLTANDILSLPVMAFRYLFQKRKPIVDITKRQGVGTRNPLRSQYDENDEYRMKTVSLNYLLQVNKFVKKAFKGASKIICPVLIMQGTDDQLVSRDGVREFFNNLTVKDKKLIVLDGAYHCLYSDPAMVERGGWEELRNWILSH